MSSQQIIDDAIARLDERRNNVKTIKFNEPLDEKFKIAEIENKLEPWLEEKGLYNSKLFALYMIEFVGSEGELDKLLKRHGTAKAKKKRGYKLTPKNKDAEDGTKVLYVGKSEKKIGGRLTEHLWEASDSTGALNLHRWVNGINGTLKVIDGTLRVKVWTIRAEQPDWPEKDVKDALRDRKDALRDLEDALWHSQPPVFGRPGGR